MFPDQVPSVALSQLVKFALNQDRDAGRLALALYELLGFGLHKYFGDVKYLVATGASEGELVAALGGFDFKGIFSRLSDELKLKALTALIEYIIAQLEGKK